MPTKTSKSKLVQKKRDREQPTGYQLATDEQEQYGLIVDRIIKARNQREMPRDEFDGMSYEQAYLTNKRAAMSYLVPKRNDDEVRINTGTTEKRIELVMNELLGLNLEGEVRAFDRDDNFLQDIGEIFSDLVQRTEQIERARDKDIFIYQELLTQPSVFVEELWIKENVESNKSFRVRQRCDRRLLQGVQMYLGDINLPDTQWNEQPYIIKYARMTKDEGELLFKDLNPKKWDLVKPGAYLTVGSPTRNLYRKNNLQGDEIEAFWYMSYPDDELQIVVNGIPFLDVGEKYTDHYGGLDGYHITMVSLKPLSSDFAYGKPLTQSAKTLQALDNETIRNLIRKFRQALEPPISITGNKVFGRDIWNPGTIVQGVRKDMFEKLIDHQGVTQSEMAMLDLVEKKINEFLGSSQQDPLEGKTQVTATELNLAQRQAIKMLGMSVLSVMRLRERLVMLRVKNILTNYTQPTGVQFDPIENKVQDVYARFTIEGKNVNGKQGSRIIQFANRGLTQPETSALFQKEQQLFNQGQPTEFKVVNAKALQDLDLYFYVAVSAKERESTQMDKAMMTEMLNQGTAISQITGRQLNPNKIIERFERVYKERDLFEKAPSQMMQQLGMNQQMGMNQSATQPSMMNQEQMPTNLPRSQLLNPAMRSQMGPMKAAEIV